MILALLIGLLLLPALAWADPISIVATLAPVIGGSVAAFIVTNFATIALVSVTIWGSARARRKARQAQARARAAYNASLQDRTTTILSADPPQRFVLGRAWTGGDVVAIFTSDKQGTSSSGGSYTKPDGYKHVVIVWAHHECAGINDLAWEGRSVYPLDANGWSLNSFWAPPRTSTASKGLVGVVSRRLLLELYNSVGAVALSIGYSGARPERRDVLVPQGGPYGWYMDGSELVLPEQVLVDGLPHTVTSDDRWDVTWAANDPGRSAVRVRHYLGTPGQLADPVLKALVPDKWTDAHKGAGLCYSVITMDLERQEFQGGPQGWTADISGLKVLDPRTGVTAWTQNNALLADWLLRHPAWFGVDAADVNASRTVASANACDQPTPYWVWNGSAWVNQTQPRYTCNGVITTDMDREAVLKDIAESMAGDIYPSGQWVIMAGAYEPPVMDLTEDDLFGSINVIQAGESMGELFNSVRGRYVPASSPVEQDMTPYTNPTFAAADGVRLWTSVNLPFTNSDHRATQLARVRVELARNGLTIFFPAKMRAWPLQGGDRVRVTNRDYGWNNKVFMVTDWGFGLGAPVGLVLQEDGPEAWDYFDATLPDPTPNTDLPDPTVVPMVAGLDVRAGTAELVMDSQGSITTRVRVLWEQYGGPFMDGGWIEVRWREAGSSAWQTLRAAAGDTELFFTGPQDGTAIVVSVVVVNGLRYRSPEAIKAAVVVGKLQRPSNPVWVSLTVSEGALRGVIQRNPDLDRALPEFRYGPTEEASLPIPGVSDETGFLWASPPLGLVTVWAIHRDRSGGFSDGVSQSITITAASLGGVPLIAKGAGQLKIEGRKITKVGGGYAWDAGAYSKHAFVGGAYCSAVPLRNDTHIMLALNDNPTAGAGFLTLDYALYAEGNAKLYIYESGVDVVGIVGTYVAGDVLSVQYDGSKVRYTKNGTVLREISAPAGRTMYFDSSFATVGGALESIEFGPMSANNWGAVNGRPKTFAVRASGFNANPSLPGAQTPSGWWDGLRDAETNAEVGAPQPGYGVTELDRSGNRVGTTQGFFPLQNAAYASAMAARLNAIPNGNIVVIATLDEPQGNRGEGGLPDAMYRCGASRAVFGSSRFQFRSAYILVGVAGSGEGMGAEVYSGAVQSDPNAWCELGFQIQGGVLTVSGANGGARSLFDFGYIQAENMAVGALYQSYNARVAGPVGWNGGIS